MHKKLFNRLFICLLFFTQIVLAGTSDEQSPNIKTQSVAYTVNGEEFAGYYAYDANQTGKHPGVLVVHEWWGQNAYARKRAEDLAKEGYPAFALDMYGTGKATEHPDEATAFMQATFEKADTIPERFDAAYNWLKQQPQVDAEHIAAIGYCYGGGVVLAMARAGKDLDAVASFHGSLATETPAEKGEVKAKVAVFTGADDKMVPPEQVQAFEQEMQNAGVDYMLKSYPNTLHSFTNPAATELGKKTGMPIAYNAEADKDSWQRMLEVFEEAFGE